MNIIELFKKGNQELFHSSFIAWLMNKDGEHGFGNRLAKRILKKIDYDIKADYKIETEYSDGANRYDIFIQQKNYKSLILENKVKSFGSKNQSERYLKSGYAFSYLALLRETIENSGKINIIYYKDVLDSISEEKLNLNNHYHFLINEYKNFLSKTIAVFTIVKKYCEGDIIWQDAKKSFEENLKGTTTKDNDVRTYSYYFYYIFIEYLRKKSSDLIFGKLNYKESEIANENTKWEFEKNMQGPPFLEALIRKFNQPGVNFSFDKNFLHFVKGKNLIIIPRAEIWIDPQALVEETSKIGKIKLGAIGTQSAELMNFLKNNEPYRATLKMIGRRHFHYEDIRVKDLVFPNFEQKIRNMMSKIGMFNVA